MTSAGPGLLSRPFLAYAAIMLLAFVNLAAFFHFQDYLSGLGLDEASSGLIIGLFALVSLVVRPLVSPLITLSRARTWTGWSILALSAVVFGYGLAQGPAGLALVRLAHGLVHTVLAAAAMTGIVALIPPSRSAQAFALLSLLTLLPYAVVPPLAGALIGRLGGFPPFLNLTGLVLLAGLALLPWARPPQEARTGPAERPAWAEIRANLADRRILALLFASLLVYAAFAAVFFFLKDYALRLGLADPGWFFTLSTVTEMGVRLVGGRWLDRGPKPLVLAGSLALLILAYLLLAGRPGETVFLGLGLLFGLGWGVAMPLFNALLFDLSPLRLRAFNANLGMQMFQGGFLVGPLAGGLALAGADHPALFLGCALACALAAALALGLRRPSTPTAPRGTP